MIRRGASAVVVLTACQAATVDEATPFVVTPTVVSCAAGERTPLVVASGGTGRAPFDLSLGGDVVRLVDVDRARGAATVVCSAAGSGSITVVGTGVRTIIPVTVRSAPVGTVRITSMPNALALINGTTTFVSASVTSSSIDASVEARYTSSDTSVAVVDSITGQVRATGPGMAAIVARSRAEPAARATTSVSATPGSTLVAGLALSNPPLTLLIGDSSDVRATVFLTSTAPASTSLATTYATTDSQVVRVSSAGRLRALRAGSASIIVAAAAAPLIRTTLTIIVLEPAP